MVQKALVAQKKIGNLSSPAPLLVSFQKYVLALMTRAIASVQKALVALWLISKGCFGSDERHTCIISKGSCGSFCKDYERGASFQKNAVALMTRALLGGYD